MHIASVVRIALDRLLAMPEDEARRNGVALTYECPMEQHTQRHAVMHLDQRARRDQHEEIRFWITCECGHREAKSVTTPLAR